MPFKPAIWSNHKQVRKKQERNAKWLMPCMTYQGHSGYRHHQHGKYPTHQANRYPMSDAIEESQDTASSLVNKPRESAPDAKEFAIARQTAESIQMETTRDRHHNANVVRFFSPNNARSIRHIGTGSNAKHSGQSKRIQIVEPSAKTHCRRTKTLRYSFRPPTIEEHRSKHTDYHRRAPCRHGRQALTTFKSPIEGIQCLRVTTSGATNQHTNTECYSGAMAAPFQ